MPTIWHIPDDLLNEFKQVLPPEKPAGRLQEMLYNIEEYWMEYCSC